MPDCSHVECLQEPPPEIAATLAVLDGKWKMLILWQLFRRTCRFNEMRRAIPGVSQHMLTVQLQGTRKRRNYQPHRLSGGAAPG